MIDEIWWLPIKDGDPIARQLADRHYSRKTIGAALFVGPGVKLVMTLPTYDALFVWRKSEFRRDGQTGVECTLFRNESNFLSSDLIRESVKMAWQRWPNERLFTYVKDSAIKSVNPGYCFKKAGWHTCGRSKVHKLTILELLPEEALSDGEI